MKSIACFFAFIFLATYTLANNNDYSKGFIISLRGDTTIGYIEYTGDYEVRESLKFKTSTADDTVRVYTPDSIKQFGFESGDLFETATYRRINNKRGEDGQRYFARVLLKADYSLYKLHLSSSYETDYVYIVLKDEKYYTIEPEKDLENRNTGNVSSKSLGNLIYLASFCPTGRPDTIKNVEFNDNAIILILSQYSTCSVASFPKEVYLDRKKVKVGLLLEVGMGGGVISDNDVYAYSGAVFCSLSNPNISEKFSALLGINFLLLRNVKGDDKMFKIPLIFNYSLYRKERKSLDINMGLNFTYWSDPLDFNLSLGASYRVKNLRLSLCYENAISPLRKGIEKRYGYGELKVGYYLW